MVHGPNLFRQLSQKKIENHPNLMKVLSNVGWLAFDRGFQLFTSFLIVVWVIRYLGPQQFGLLSYAAAFSGLFSAIAYLGIPNILIKELVHADENKTYKILGTAFVLLFVSGIIALLISLGAIILVNPGELSVWLLVVFASASFIFYPFTVMASWFDSRVESKFSVLSRNGVLVIACIIKIILILTNSPLLYFAIEGFLESILIGAFLAYFYFKQKQNIFAWRFDFEVAKNLLKSGAPLILSGAAVLVYLRIDQVIIGHFLSTFDVGIYAVAVKIAEFGGFIPGILIASLFPSIVMSKKNSEKLFISRFGKLYDFLVLTSFSIALIITLFSNQIIALLYGEAYSGAGIILSIYVWSIVPWFLSLAMNQYFVVDNKTIYSLYAALIGCVSNILLNVLLIPLYGMPGAAVATVVSYSLVILSTFLFKETRQHGFLILNSFNPIGVFSRLYKMIFS